MIKISLITTVFNEEDTIKLLFDSILEQSFLPDEIIVVDGRSTDNTKKLIAKYKLRISNLRIITKKGNRAVGRNEAIKHVTGNIIVCSDSGNVLDKNWLENITKPFKDKKTDVVAGYYKGLPKNIFQKCLIPYVLVMPDKVDPNNFLPATRSMAFTKKIWEKVGGFDEKYSHNEDYVFANKLKKAGVRIVFEKDAIVNWIPRNSYKEAFLMFFRFALGDAEARIFRPKVIIIFARYVLGLLLFLLAVRYHSLSLLIVFGIFSYILWSIWKNYKYCKSIQAFYYLPLLQLTSDIAVLIGTLIGFLKKKNV